MPELPEVQTTVDGLNHEVKGWTIIDVWTDYNSPFHSQKDNIKNPKYFSFFKNEILGATILETKRRAKNILISLSCGKTVLIHMKMTGHIMCGSYIFHKNTKVDPWKASDTRPTNPLNDPFNRFIHLVFTVSKPVDRSVRGSGSGKTVEKQIVLSDMRKFAKVTLLDSGKLVESDELRHLGPEPLEDNFIFSLFESQLMKRKTAPIKQALMDQSLIAGVGNIYSDEILWRAGVHPKSHFSKIPQEKRKEMFCATKEMLNKGIDFGGDSMSDYRNIHGLPGKFQGEHKAYRRTGKGCEKKGCSGTIKRLVIGGRSGHFCDTHQELFS